MLGTLQEQYKKFCPKYWLIKDFLSRFLAVCLGSLLMQAGLANEFKSSIHNLKVSQEESINCIAASGISVEDALGFLTELQNAIKNNEKVSLMKLVHYPLRINNRDKNLMIHTFYIEDKREFLTKYNKLITPSLKKITLQQKPSDIFCNAQGGMLAGGRIWFNYDHGLKIFVINL